MAPMLDEMVYENIMKHETSQNTLSKFHFSNPITKSMTLLNNNLKSYDPTPKTQSQNRIPP